MNKKILILIIIIPVLILGATLFLINQKPTSRQQTKCSEEYLKLTPEEKNILASADERIKEYRTGTARLNFVTASGKPVPNAKIKIEQTSHEFLFGANHDIGTWEEIADKKLGMPTKNTALSEKQLDDYLNKFNQFANYYNIPVYWPYYEPNNDEYSHELFDKIFDWVAKQKQGKFTVRASPSVWNNLLVPKWTPSNCDQLSTQIEEKLNDFTLRYKGRYDYLHVINELANPFRKIFSGVQMTNCIREAGQVEWGKKWLGLARKIDPAAKLQINEVTIHPEKGFPELLEGLKDRSSKPMYDTIGLQSHMHDELWDLNGLWQGLEYYSTFGVSLHATEVTILSGTPISGKKFGMTSTRKGECQQAEYAVNFYTVLFSHPSVEAITWWNLSDYKAWKNAPAGLLRKDMSPKPAYSALMNLIYKEWRTETVKTTSNLGQAEFTGFFGNYIITVITDSGEVQTFNIELLKEGKQIFRLVLQN